MSSCDTGYTACVMPTAGAAWRAQVDGRGVCRASRASRVTIGAGIVALKNSVWRLRRHVLEHAPDVGQEAHVEHAVGFVEHEELEAGQLGVGRPEVVEEAPGRRDHDVDPAPERVLLRSHAHAAEDGRAR